MLNKRYLGFDKFSLADNVTTDYQLFILGYLLMFIPLFLTTTMLGTALPHVLLSILKYTGFFLIIIDVLFYKKIDVKNLVWFLILGTLITVNYRISHDTNLFFAMAIIVGSYGIDYKKIIFPYIVTSIVLLTTVVVLSLIGVIQNIEYVRGDTIRMALGIIYPTDLGARMFYLTVALFVYRWEKVNVKDIFVYLVIAGLTWKITYARMDTFLILALTFCALIVLLNNKFPKSKYWKYLSNILCAVNVFVPVLAFFVVNWLSYSFKSGVSFYVKMDSILSGRLALGHTAYQYYPVKFWGQGITQQGWGGVAAKNSATINYFMIDSAFVRLVLVYGLLLTLVVLICWSFLMIDLREKKLLAISLVLTIIAISGIIDQHMFEIAYNPLLIFFSFCLVDKNIYHKEESML